MDTNINQLSTSTRPNDQRDMSPPKAPLRQVRIIKSNIPPDNRVLPKLPDFS